MEKPNPIEQQAHVTQIAPKIMATALTGSVPARSIRPPETNVAVPNQSKAGSARSVETGHPPKALVVSRQMPSARALANSIPPTTPTQTTAFTAFECPEPAVVLTQAGTA